MGKEERGGIKLFIITKGKQGRCLSEQGNLGGVVNEEGEEKIEVEI